MILLPDQPQSIGKVLDSGFKLFSRSIKPAFMLAIIPSVISALPDLVAGLMAKRLFEPDFSNVGFVVALIVFFGATIIISFAIYNALLFRIWGIAQDKDPGFTDSLIKGFKKLFPVLFGSLFYLIAVVIGFCLLIVPGIIISLSLIYYSFLIVLKDEGVIASLKHSHRLVWGNWWRILVIISVPVIIAMILFSVAFFAEISLLSVADITTDSPLFETTFTFYYSLIMIVLNGLLTPLYISVLVVSFNDILLQKEGADLEQRIDAVVEGA